MKTYKFNGETFELDDSEGCFVKVTYGGQVAHLGVNLYDGTDKRPFKYAGSWQGTPQEGGLTWGYDASTYAQGLEGVCRLLLKRQEEVKFDREKACETLHDETARLPAA